MTAAEVLAARREFGSADTGEAQATAAWLLLGLADDPIPALREMIKHPDTELCVFGVATAGMLGDLRLELDVDALSADKRKLAGRTGGAVWKDTVGIWAEEALTDLVGGGVLAGDREEGAAIGYPGGWNPCPWDRMNLNSRRAKHGSV